MNIKAEMRLSPRLNQHASGVVLGVTQIINGLYNPVIISILILIIIIIITMTYSHLVECGRWEYDGGPS